MLLKLSGGSNIWLVSNYTDHTISDWDVIDPVYSDML